jgi:predicted GIY-YIG superfamily endonuclease
MKNWWLYVLRCEQGKYYIGITSSTPEKRFQQHVSGFAGAAWTQKYKPIEIFYKDSLGYLATDRAKEFENKVAREYIKKYGIENVRGGDINYSGEMIKIFGYYYRKEDLKIIPPVLFMMLVILFLWIMYFLK